MIVDLSLLNPNYNQQVFSLDGRIALDLTFGETTMKTMVYVKMDATEQLLLGEGVCRQLGIVTYHPDVEPCQETAETSDAAVQVPTVKSPTPKVCVHSPSRVYLCCCQNNWFPVWPRYHDAGF